MKYILIFFSLLLFSCGSEIEEPESKFATIPTDEEISTQLERNQYNTNQDMMSNILNSEEDIYASENRDLWQQPQIIINYLGDLKGKVLADIGAGPNGYFTFIIATRTNVDKVIAIDIDKDAIDVIDLYKHKLTDELQEKVETRLVDPSDPKIKEGEADFILISNTLTYIDDKLAYLEKLKKGLKKDGRILIIDSKMKKLPKIFPGRAFRMPLYEMEEMIEKAGFKHVLSDDGALNYQYIVLGKVPK